MEIHLTVGKQTFDFNMSMLRKLVTKHVSHVYKNKLQAERRVTNRKLSAHDCQNIGDELTMYRFAARVIEDVYGVSVASDLQRGVNACYHELHKFMSYFELDKYPDYESGSTSKRNVEMAVQNRLEELWRNFTRVAREKNYEDMSIAGLENFTQEMKVHTAIINHWQETYEHPLCIDLHKHCIQFVEHLKEKVREAKQNQDKENQPPQHQYNLRPRA